MAAKVAEQYDVVIIGAGFSGNGILGTEPNGKQIALTGTAVWTVDGEKLQHGWIEQANFELYHWLLAK
jgi:hypothetical protein